MSEKIIGWEITVARDANCPNPTRGVDQVTYKITDMPTEQIAKTKAGIMGIVALARCEACNLYLIDCPFKPMPYSSKPITAP